MSRAAAAFSSAKSMSAGRQRQRLPLEPAFEQHRPPGVARARKACASSALSRSNWSAVSAAAVAGVIDQRARGPRRVLEQRAVPARGGVVDRHRLLRRGEAARRRNGRRPGGSALRWIRLRPAVLVLERRSSASGRRPCSGRRPASRRRRRPPSPARAAARTARPAAPRAVAHAPGHSRCRAAAAARPASRAATARRSSPRPAPAPPRRSASSGALPTPSATSRTARCATGLSRKACAHARCGIRTAAARRPGSNAAGHGEVKLRASGTRSPAAALEGGARAVEEGHRISFRANPRRG